MTPELDDAIPQPGSDSAVDDTRQRILQAAAQVFAEKGYSRATTRALAAAAGVNEVTLFRHFGNKQNLFATLIDEYAASAITSSLEGQLTGDYRQDLVLMGHHLLQAVVERSDAVRLMLCEAAHFPEVREALAQNPRQLRLMLAGYLEQQMAQGKVRTLHAEATAQAFWGMFFAYGIGLGILQEPVSPELAPEELVALFVDIFVNGTAVGGENNDRASN
jgi:AcrR family transcriptional regulator